ncbi:MAG TPA: PP2C family protein-serine/threonine phosphatase [Candidatus Dormibacteraeota bacterium]|jgi:sigma-B regulation protein RsbU (phosphoserine phosphatase)|nr:PP2C family protein-serine/threonine phosphatase [Candidatus Dormibacteraeota bacterium]
MKPTPQKTVQLRVPPELEESLGQLEGRIPADELALRVVRATMAIPGVAGVRLWKVEQDSANVWAEIGAVPAEINRPARLFSAGKSEVPDTVWTGALGSDDFRMRILEVHGQSAFSEELQSQLALLARFAALALALAERRGTMEELSSIVEATKKLNSTLDLGELIHIILQIATRQTGAGRGTVFLVDAEKNEIWSLVGLGLEQQVIRLPADRGIAGWVAQNGRSVRLENAYEDPRFEPEVDRRLGFTTKRLLCLPIRNEAGNIVGVLQLLNKEEAFTSEDEAFLDALSAHVAIALEKAQLHRERVEKEKLERDLSLAREIQAGLLPDAPPVIAGIEIAVSHRASQMVGGDYYDFLRLPPEEKGGLLIVVADVEGKGAASALVMANVQATLHALADQPGPLEKLPATINQKMLVAGSGGRRTKYLSMFLAALDENGRKLRYVNAGHVPPAVIRADGSCEWLTEGGMVVGLLPEQEYLCGELALDKDDLLVACTDGITEAMDSGGNEFGRPRLAELVSRLRALAPQEILDGVLEAVNAHAHGGIYEDDRILMVLKAL